MSLTTIFSPDPLRSLKKVAENLRKHFIDKLSWTTTDSLARAGLSSGAGGLDLVFVFDSSASVGQKNFQKGIAFAKTIIDEFGISNSSMGTRVAVVTFSSTAKVIFNLKTNAMPNKTKPLQLWVSQFFALWCFLWIMFQRTFKWKSWGENLRCHLRSVVFLLPPGWDASPPQVTPSIKFAGTHLHTLVERSTGKVKCLARGLNTTCPARSGVEHTNHEATPPLVVSG